MKVDTVITLNDNKKYLLLLESELELEGYFLAVLLDEKDEPTNVYAVLKEVEKDGKTYVKKENDPIIENQLLEDYRNQYEDILEESRAA